MAKKETEPKVVLEREYIIPLRRKWLKVPEYKRANKAVKSVKQFLVRHMKVYDKDLDKIKVDVILNNELRFRGMRKPPAKIKVKAKKYDNGTIRAELSEIPQIIRYKLERERRKREEVKKKAKEEKKEEKLEEKIERGKEAEKKEEKAEEKEEEKKEKKEAVKEAGLKMAKEEHKKMRHEVAGKKIKKQPLQRMALQK